MLVWVDIVQEISYVSKCWGFGCMREREWIKLVEIWFPWRYTFGQYAGKSFIEKTCWVGETFLLCCEHAFVTVFRQKAFPNFKIQIDIALKNTHGTQTLVNKLILFRAFMIEYCLCPFPRWRLNFGTWAYSSIPISS